MVMWIEPWQPLPSARRAMAEPNGLVAATRSLSPRRLLEAYGKGLFPWYSEGQPVLWWSPDPRMVARPDAFVPRRSLRKRIRAIDRDGAWQIVLNGNFRQVIEACAAPRRDGAGTWITPAVIDAYVGLHRLGHAHSFEIRDRDGSLLAGLYGVAIGRMFFGESMFTRVPDGSKCAYAAMMATLQALKVPMVDCQQSTAHLESLGAGEISRDCFLDQVAALVQQPMPSWDDVAIKWPVYETAGGDPGVDETDVLRRGRNGMDGRGARLAPAGSIRDTDPAILMPSGPAVQPPGLPSPDVPSLDLPSSVVPSSAGSGSGLASPVPTPAVFPIRDASPSRRAGLESPAPLPGEPGDPER